MYHVGITHVGLPGGGSFPSSSAFTCCAVIRLPQPKYSVRGVLAFLGESYFPLQGRVFSPSVRWGIPARGLCILPFRRSIQWSGTLTKSGKASLSVAGYKALIPFRRAWSVKATKRKQRRYTYSVEAITNKFLSDRILLQGKTVLCRDKSLKMTGFIVGVHRLFALVKGDKAGKVRRFVRVRGAIQRATSGVYRLTATAAESVYAGVISMGQIQVNHDCEIKVTGRLFSKIMHSLYCLQGFVPKIAFIASVPRRFQDFVTNKRWFR